MGSRASGLIRWWGDYGIRASNRRTAVHSLVSGDFLFFSGLRDVRYWKSLVFFPPRMTSRITDRTSTMGRYIGFVVSLSQPSIFTIRRESVWMCLFQSLGHICSVWVHPLPGIIQHAVSVKRDIHGSPMTLEDLFCLDKEASCTCS